VGLNLKTQTTETMIYVDQAVTIGTLQERLLPKQTDQKEVNGTYLMILEKDNLGYWRINRLIWNSNAP